VLAGNPNPKYISTSYVERQNLSMRMGMRRFTRLTNGFSKKFENHAHQVALYFFHYNFCRVHTTLRVTPAMEAGLTDHVWTLAELCSLLPEKKPNARVDKELVFEGAPKESLEDLWQRQIRFLFRTLTQASSMWESAAYRQDTGNPGQR
jgi:hypothetical protein